MSLAQRFERRLEGLVGGAFARVFKGQVEPVEIGTALQREAADKRNVMGNGQVLCPNRYRVTLSPEDHERLLPWEMQLTGSLAELVQEYLDENRWSTIGDIEVYLARDDELHTGVFGVASRMEPGAPPRRRPHDSLSLPIVSGAPDQDFAAQREPAQGYPAQGYPAQGYRDFPADGYQDYPGAAQTVGAGRSAPPMPGGPMPGAPMPGGPMPGPPMPGAPMPGPPGPGFPQQGNAYGNPYAPGGGGGYPPAPPARAAGAMLIVDQSNRRFDLRTGNNVIGRGTDADLQLLDQGISRRHVDIQYDGNVATAYDLGSTNGTTVNGHEISSQQLRHGDVVRVGHTRIVFHQERR